MAYPKPVKRSTIIKAVATVLSFIIILILAPRMDEPRIISGIEFTTKSGGTGLTNLGWALLVLVPVAIYIITTFLLKVTNYKDN